MLWFPSTKILLKKYSTEIVSVDTYFALYILVHSIDYNIYFY